METSNGYPFWLRKLSETSNGYPFWLRKLLETSNGYPFCPTKGLASSTQHENVTQADYFLIFAALNSPAPFDRLGGGLVDSFIYHMLSKDNSANLQHYFEKKEWMRDFFFE